MSLSKNNLDKLKSILKKESFQNIFSPQSLDLSKINQTNPSNNDNPEELFIQLLIIHLPWKRLRLLALN